jgi:phosphoadenosine phosphosulfate reductase
MHFEARRAVGELRSLTPADPALLLQSAVERFGRRVALATALGPGSLALLDMVHRAEIPLRVFVLDTGLLFDETYGLWSEIEQRYGIALEAVKPDPANAEADRLWQTNPDSCCRRRKVEPLRRLLAGMDAWVTGIRRDQGDARAESQQVEWDPQFGVIKLNPLALWSRSEVDAYIERHNVPVNPLVARGYRSIGCWPCTAPVAPEALERAGRWTGRAKTECGIHSRPPVAPRARRS